MKCSLKDLTILLLSCVIISAFFFGSFTVIFHGETVKSTEIFTLVYGSVSTMTGSVLQYWFGTSRTSADKDQAIQTLTKAA